MNMKYFFIFAILLAHVHMAFGQIDTIKSFWQNGRLSTEEYNVEGKGWGFMNVWYENGIKAENHIYRDGLLFSYNIEWYRNGNIKDEKIITGFDIVPEIDTNTGATISEVTYLSGRFISYRENGTKISDGHMIGGKKIGKWSYYDGEGKTLYEEWYENGEAVSKFDYRIMSK